MKTSILTFLCIILPILYSTGQVIIRGKVIDKSKEKVLANVYHFGSNISGDFVGDFKISLDSLGGTYFFEALGYETKRVIIQDSSFLTIVLQERKHRPRKISRSIKREKKAMEKLRKKIRTGRMPVTGGCCFVADTPVQMADGTQRNIENLMIGDSILSYDFDSQMIIVSAINQIDRVLHDNIIEIELENGVRIKNTSDHPYYVYGKGICSYDPEQTSENYRIEAKQLQVGDTCYSYLSREMFFTKILTIQKVKGSFITYNLSELNNNNNYFVNGILVNNEKELPTYLSKE